MINDHIAELILDAHNLPMAADHIGEFVIVNNRLFKAGRRVVVDHVDNLYTAKTQYCWELCDRKREPLGVFIVK